LKSAKRRHTPTGQKSILRAIRDDAAGRQLITFSSSSSSSSGSSVTVLQHPVIAGAMWTIRYGAAHVSGAAPRPPPPLLANTQKRSMTATQTSSDPLAPL